MPKKPWQNKIVGYGTVSVGELLGNDQNFRIHPTSQQKAMEALLDEVGWVAPLLVSQRTHKVLDGNMRSQLALRRRDDEPVPVVLLDLTEEEERLVVASFDPIGNLAVADNTMLSNLLGSIARPNQEIGAFLDSLSKPVTGEGETLGAKPKGKAKKSTSCPQCGHTFIPT